MSTTTLTSIITTLTPLHTLASQTLGPHSNTLLLQTSTPITTTTITSNFYTILQNLNQSNPVIKLIVDCVTLENDGSNRIIHYLTSALKFIHGKVFDKQIANRTLFLHQCANFYRFLTVNVLPPLLKKWLTQSTFRIKDDHNSISKIIRSSLSNTFSTTETSHIETLLLDLVQLTRETETECGDVTPTFLLFSGFSVKKSRVADCRLEFYVSRLCVRNDNEKNDDVKFVIMECNPFNVTESTINYDYNQNKDKITTIESTQSSLLTSHLNDLSVTLIITTFPLIPQFISQLMKRNVAYIQCVDGEEILNLQGLCGIQFYEFNDDTDYGNVVGVCDSMKYVKSNTSSIMNSGDYTFLVNARSQSGFRSKSLLQTTIPHPQILLCSYSIRKLEIIEDAILRVLNNLNLWINDVSVREAGLIKVGGYFEFEVVRLIDVVVRYLKFGDIDGEVSDDVRVIADVRCNLDVKIACFEGLREGMVSVVESLCSGDGRSGILKLLEMEEERKREIEKVSVESEEEEEDDEWSWDTKTQIITKNDPLDILTLSSNLIVTATQFLATLLKVDSVINIKGVRDKRGEGKEIVLKQGKERGLRGRLRFGEEDEIGDEDDDDE